MSKKLSYVDKGFLLAESREMPMHVGGVSLYSLPDGADEHEFIHSLAANVRNTDALLPPFGERLKTGRLGLAGNVFWEDDPSMDMDYHVRHSALPKPGRYRELFNLVSRLHGTLLERSRPLWEMHLIEGLPDRQFAVYTKSHHAAVDGARSVHISRSMLSADPNSILDESPLSLKSWQRYKNSIRAGESDAPTEAELRNAADMIKSTFDSGANIFRAMSGFAKGWAGRGGDLVLPHRKVPRSSLNGNIDGARRFVAQSWPFARIHKMGKAYGGTFNDAVLAMCGGALRRYLIEHAELPEESLKSMIPVSLRQKGDVDSGNAVATISADLGTNISDPVERITTIIASVQAGKAFYEGMSPKEIELVSMIMQSPAALLMPLGLLPKLPPYNVAISNVPGIREPMYWNGAKLNGNYPVSIITDGMALNITLVTYDQNVDFGIIACRRSVPQVQRLIDYMEEALTELELAAGIRYQADAAPKTTASTPKRKAPAAKKPAAKKAAAKKPAARKKAPAKKKAVAKTKVAANAPEEQQTSAALGD